MTQTNNEREALLDKLLAEYWDIAYSEGNSGLWHGKKAQSTLNDIRKLFKTQSPISQNEQQEAVAFMDEDGEIYALPEQKLLNISIDDLIKSIGKNGVRLYTSPPKRKWIGLSNDEIQNLNDVFGYFKYGDAQGGKSLAFYKAIEAKLKEVNGYD